MFSGCSSLTTAPSLPATKLANDCYNSMFRSCSSLTTAPELPATTLAASCYKEMFNRCSSLSNIHCYAENPNSDGLSNWVIGVASTGEFTKNKSVEWSIGVSGIPAGWTVNEIGSAEPELNYLTFTAEENNSTISLNAKTSPDIKYSLNSGKWTQWDYSAITLNTGDTVRMKGNNSNGFTTSNSSYNQFSMTGKISASGNIMSLLYGDDFEGNLIIPCNYCYYGMFKGCTSLTSAPVLPATTLKMSCYHIMFNGCTALTTAPELPATTLADNCYSAMFSGCTALTTAPELPATRLKTSCYSTMFYSCSSLTTAPELPATTLAGRCYYNMFKNCTSLNYIKMLATNISDNRCLYNWVYNVASTGTFIKHPNMTSLPSGNSGIPAGWTVNDI